MVKKSIILLTVCLIKFSYGQFDYLFLANDFRVSDDNTPSTFKQEGTRLFPDNLSGGLYTWQDYRFGELSYFAQRIDSLGNKIGDNFQILSDLDLCFAPNGSFLVLREQTYSSLFPGGWDGSYTIEGKIYLNENTSLPPFYMAGGILPWCGTGWLGIHNTLARTDNYYLNFHASGGAVSFGKYDFNGNLVFQINSYDILPLNAFDIACASNKANEYVLFSLQNSLDFSTGRLYGTFFSSKDSIISNNVLIDTLKFEVISPQSDNLRVISIQDSIYQVFLASSDSLVIYSYKVNRDGTIINSQSSLRLFTSELTGNNIYRVISNFTITQLNDNKFSLLVTVNESRYPSQRDFNSLFTFNKNGELIEARYDSTLSFQLGRYFLRTNSDDLLIPYSYNQDAYQKMIHDFVTFDSLKLNNDIVGSNELSPSLKIINDAEMLITYIDEKNIIAKKIDYAGNLLTNEIILENRDLNFFSDGWSVSVWYEEKPDAYEQRIGFTIYNQNFEMQKKIYLTSFQWSNTSISSHIISDSVFVIAFYDNKNFFVRLYNRDGEMQKERLLLSDVYHYSISIFKENQNSFLVSTYQYSQMFDNELEIISPQFSQYVSYYLGSLKMLSISTDDYSHLFGQIYNLDGSTITEKFLLATSSADFYFDRLNNDYFAILFKINNKIFVKCFTSFGNQIGDSILIHSSLTGWRKSPSFTVSDNKVFFTWSDARNTDNGYDVYCSIFNLSDLTDIENKNDVSEISDFKLYQNYPNPFNPSTKIRYTIPSVGTSLMKFPQFVQLKVYDILGNEVTTLVDEYKPAGNYEVEFSAKGGQAVGDRQLASGIYYYQLKAGSFIQTKKLILMK